MAAGAISFAEVDPRIKRDILQGYELDSLVNNMADQPNQDGKFRQRDGLWFYEDRLYIPNVAVIRQTHSCLSITTHPCTDTWGLTKPWQHCRKYSTGSEIVHQNLQLLPTKQAQQHEKGRAAPEPGHPGILLAECKHRLYHPAARDAKRQRRLDGGGQPLVQNGHTDPDADDSDGGWRRQAILRERLQGSWPCPSYPTVSQGSREISGTICGSWIWSLSAVTGFIRLAAAPRFKSNHAGHPFRKPGRTSGCCISSA